MEFEDEFDLMEAFAKACATGGDPFKHAQRLVPGQQGLQLEMCNDWPKRPEFKAMLADYRDRLPPVSEVPSKDELIKALWDRVQDGDEALKDVTAAAKQISEMLGYVEKNNAAVNVFVNNKVMRIPAPMALDDFEQAAQRQQKESLNVSRTRH